MSKQFIHFGGLKPDEQGWYYNRRGAQVFVHSGDWAFLAPDNHPELRYLLESGAAVVSESPPVDVEVLDDDTDFNRTRNRIADKRARISQGAGLPDVHELTPTEIERALELFLPRELPEVVADSYVDARVVDRHRTPLAVDVPIPLYANILILHRLSWLFVRAHRAAWARRVKQIRSQRSRWIEQYHYEWDSPRSDLRLQTQRRFPLPPKPALSPRDILVS